VSECWRLAISRFLWIKLTIMFDKLIQFGQLIFSWHNMLIWQSFCKLSKYRLPCEVSVSISVLSGKKSLWQLGSGCRLLDTLLLAPTEPCKMPMRFDDACCEVIGRWVNLIKHIHKPDIFLLKNYLLLVISEQKDAWFVNLCLFQNFM